jgi:thioredoxin 1
MTGTTLRRGALAALAALSLAACGTASTDTQAGSTPSASEVPAATSTSTPTAESASPTASATPAESSAEPAPTAGAYVDYADWNADPAAFGTGDVVLFFAASWCPTCREADANLTADPAAIPAGLTIVKTDYDSETELRQRYGVTVQHTFVQVDEQGEALAKWTGSSTADDIAGKVV